VIIRARQRYLRWVARRHGLEIASLGTRGAEDDEFDAERLQGLFTGEKVTAVVAEDREREVAAP